MQIKGMSSAVTAALFPSKQKRNDEQSIADELSQQAGPRATVSPEPQWQAAATPQPARFQAQPQRVTLIDLLRHKPAEENRAAATFNAVRLGRTPPGGMFGITSGPASPDGERGTVNSWRVDAELDGPSIRVVGYIRRRHSVSTQHARSLRCLPLHSQQTIAQSATGSKRTGIIAS
jgi:hypothetical protein